MKLSNWAKKQGISYRTAYNWFKTGRIPNAVQYDTGTILVNEFDENISKYERNVIYCRVSSYNKKNDLKSQIERCEAFCQAKGLPVSKVYKEIASGMNDTRKYLFKMLESKPTTIVIENKDRLTRFGFNYLKFFLKKNGCKILILNEDKENETDLIKDMVSIMTSFCCRLYGLRRGQHKIKKIKEIIDE